ncbi:MAG: hypothetical protein U1E91_04780 [Moraxella sp.]
MSIDFTSHRLSYEQGELIESHLPEQPKLFITNFFKGAASD